MTVKLELRDQVALITMDDGKMNALTRDAAKDILAALDEAEAKAKAIVLAGRPGAFCAGFDLKTMTGDDQASAAALLNDGGTVLYRLFSTGLPLVAASTGHAMALGALMLLTCDTRIGEKGDFKYGLSETALGMTLPAWSIGPLKTRLARSAYIPVAVQSSILDPAGAVAAGFLDETVQKDEAVDSALQLAATLANLPASAYADNKLQVRQEALQSMRAALT